jgi:hypothetical protein
LDGFTTRRAIFEDADVELRDPHVIVEHPSGDGRDDGMSEVASVARHPDDFTRDLWRMADTPDRSQFDAPGVRFFE